MDGMDGMDEGPGHPGARWRRWRGGAWCGWIDPAWAPVIGEAEPLEWIEAHCEAEMARRATAVTWRVRLPDGRCGYAKHLTAPKDPHRQRFGPLDRWRWNLVSRMGRLARTSRRLERAGIRVPHVWWVARRWAGWRVEEVMCCTGLEGREIEAVLRELPREAVGPVLASLGRQVGAFHTQGFVHGDMNLGNVWLDEEGRLGLVDNEGTRRVPGAFSPMIRRWKNLRKVMNGILLAVGVRGARHFWTAYAASCGLGPARSRRWWGRALGRGRAWRHRVWQRARRPA